MSQLFQQWICAMRRGDHQRAWSISERAAAVRPEAGAYQLPNHVRRTWNLQPLDGRDVTVRCYHGLGDTIQFLRFLPELQRRTASVTLEIQPALIPLLGNNPPADRVVGFDAAQPLPTKDYDVEIMELSFALRVPPAALPPPYVSVPYSKPLRGAIGICCVAGNWDEDRSIEADLLEPICRRAHCYTLDLRPSLLPVRNPQGCPRDMAQTAALVAQMSLIITVDTMIAHLAGALNKPTMLLLKHEPDWRWAPETGRSEWYPSMRLYAQPDPGDWGTVVEAVQADLNFFLARREPTG